VKNDKETAQIIGYEQRCCLHILEFETAAELFKKGDLPALAEDCEEKAFLMKAMADRGPFGNLMLTGPGQA
jgi:hypothetical protein